MTRYRREPEGFKESIARKVDARAGYWQTALVGLAVNAAKVYYLFWAMFGR